VHVFAEVHYLNMSGDSEREILGAKGFESGIGLGWEWKIPLMTSFSLSSVELTEGQNTYQAGGFKIGISYFLKESVKMNVSFQNLGASDNSSAGSNQIYQATMSFPLDFQYPKEYWRENRTAQPSGL
jgi:hypothetical protein